MLPSSVYTVFVPAVSRTFQKAARNSKKHQTTTNSHKTLLLLQPPQQTKHREFLILVADRTFIQVSCIPSHPIPSREETIFFKITCSNKKIVFMCSRTPAAFAAGIQQSCLALRHSPQRLETLKKSTSTNLEASHPQL